MSDAQQALDRLDAHAAELEQLSGLLIKVQRELEPVEAEYQEFVDSFEIGMYNRMLESGDRLPSEALRLKLARHDMPPELLGRREGLCRKRERLVSRIADLKAVVSAERSILSALKEAV